MTTTLIGLEGAMATSRQEEIELITEIANALLLEADGEVYDDRKRLLELASDLREMFFMVTVIGEFNAGKSTFINALLGEKFLEMGITPTTEYVELVRHSDIPIRTPELREDGVRVWGHPNTGANGVAIVDTPGTGSIFMKHEKIAKSFLHRSDLVIFLLSAKQAFAQTERLYLELAKNYGKKIILVINQMDLLQPQERQEVMAFVRAQVKETLSIEPPIFDISAREALQSPGNDSAGNIGAIKAHLRGVYSEIPPAKQKLLGELQTVAQLLKKHRIRAEEKAKLVSLDTDKVQGVARDLDSQTFLIDQRLRETIQNIHTVLEGVRERGNHFIEAHLRVPLFGRPKQEVLDKEFESVVIGRSWRDIEALNTSYINTLVDQSRLYWSGVVEQLDRLQTWMKQQKGTFDALVYAEQRENIEQALVVAQRELEANTSGKVMTAIKANFDQNFGVLLRTGTVVAGGVLTMILAFLTPGSITAFPLVLPALIGGAVVTAIWGLPMVRSLRDVTTKPRQEFNTRIDSLKTQYAQTLTDITYKERNRLSQYGKQQFAPVFSRLESVAKQYREEKSLLEGFERQLDALKKRIETLD